MADTPSERFRENASEIAGTVVTGVWLVALLTGQDWWLAAMLLGYMVVLPVISYLFDDGDELEEWWGGEWNDWSGEKWKQGRTDDEKSDEPTNNKEALETLRNRYARGELTDEQFERKLERLLDTESLEDVEDRAKERERERN